MTFDLRRLGGHLSDGSKAQILVVDDDPCIRQALGLLLTFAGYDVAAADNGVSAISQLNTMVPDLLVTDLNMPLMSGVELISYVRSQHPSVPIVAMSGGYHGDAVPASIIADRFYPKGQDLDHLLATIASLIATNPVHKSAQTSHGRPELDF
jgi:DNA-binding NtrC family response regulator